MGDFLKSDAFHLAWGSPCQLRLHEFTKPHGSNLAVGMEAGIGHLVPVDVVGFFLITPINHPTGVFLQGDQRVGSFLIPCTWHLPSALRNSRCQGYVTEKFFRGLRWGMVPLALGGPSHEEEATPWTALPSRAPRKNVPCRKTLQGFLFLTGVPLTAPTWTR